MYSRKQIVEIVDSYVKPEGVKHISDMLDDIQDCLINDRYPSKFIELCINEEWDHARAVADRMNKDILTTDLFKKFVKSIKTSPEYISKIREERLNKIFEK